jgi:hypothetical protein
MDIIFINDGYECHKIKNSTSVPIQSDIIEHTGLLYKVNSIKWCLDIDKIKVYLDPWTT